MKRLLLVFGFCVVAGLAALAMRQPSSGVAGTTAGLSDQRSESPASGSELQTVWLEPALSTIRPGQVFTLTVMITGATDLAAFEFDLLYEPSIVEVVTMTLGTFLGETGRNTMQAGPLIDNAAGLSILAGFTWGYEPGVTGQGELARVGLRGLAAGTSSLTLQDVQLTDPRATLLPAASQGGSVTVAAPTMRLYLPLAVKGAR